MGYRRNQRPLRTRSIIPSSLSTLAVPLLAALGILLTTSTAHSAPGLTEIRADFNSVPDSVQRYTGGLGIGDPVCFLRDIAGNEIPPTLVQHQMDGILGPELMTHTVTDKRDLTYTARGHVMTTPFNVGGFQICDNPIGSFAQSDGQTTFAVDMSTAGVAPRKWPLIWFILNGSLQTQLPGDPAFTDTVRDHADQISVPGSAIFFKPEVFNGNVGWGGWRTDGDRFGAYWEPIPVAQDFAVRTPHEFVVDGRAVEVWVGGVRLWREENVVPAAWSGHRVDVRLDFTDYNSDKEAQPPTTWHWDNIRLTGQGVAPAAGTSGSVAALGSVAPPVLAPALATPVDSTSRPNTPTLRGPAPSTAAPSAPVPSTSTAEPESSATLTVAPSPFAVLNALTNPSNWRSLFNFVIDHLRGRPRPMATSIGIHPVSQLVCESAHPASEVADHI